MSELVAAAVRADAEPCRECGAPMAADQRYCLNCGRRRGEPRLDFQRYATGAAANGADASPPLPTPQPAQPAPEKGGRDYTPLAAAGGIAVLGLMLLVGVLIGRGDGSSSAPATAPVVRLPAAGEAEGEGAKDTGGGGGGKGGGLGLDGKGGKKSKGASKAAKPPPDAVVSDDELKALEEQSPQEYAENSAKLPDEIATPGAAPPVDSKKPGGGSSGTTIE